MAANQARAKVEVPAHELLSKFEVANKLSCKLTGAMAIMQILAADWADNTPENNALFAVLEMIEDSLTMSDSLQWTFDYEERAKDALGLQA